MKNLITLGVILLSINLAFAQQNVGVGTATPANKLSVKGSASIGTTYANIIAPPNTMIVEKRFGIGVTTPECPLGIKGDELNHDEMISLISTDATQNWNINLNPTDLNVPGFSIDDMSSGLSTSRFFIQPVDGNVGIGTTQPKEKLHIEGSVDGGMTGIQIRNTASTHNEGWVLGHFEDGDIPDQDGRFVVTESLGGLPNIERITVLSGGNTGINETIPDTKLHVSRDPADPNSLVGLSTGTGIMEVGPITDNIVADYKGIQARHGEYVGSVLNLATSELNLQRLGGDVLIHGDNSIPERVIVTSDGNLGLGTINPLEKIDINGAIKIGNTSNNNLGTIRYTGTDFEGRTASGWTSLTTGGPWTNVGVDEIAYTSSHAKVGIGTNTPSETLDINGSDPGGETSIKILNTACANAHPGWLLSHIDDGAVPDRVGALSIAEKIGGGGSIERITVLPTLQRVGINEKLPYSTLHVSRDLAEPEADGSLMKGSGIAMFGPMEKNIIIDSHNIQARNSNTPGAADFAVAPLDLQGLGGDIVIHGSNLIDSQINILDDGRMGIGKTPIEKLDVNGAVTFGDTYTVSPAEGTVRWHAATPGNPADLQVFKDGVWKSLTTQQTITDGFAPVGPNSIAYEPAGNAKVGIGINTPTNALMVDEHSSVTNGNVGVMMMNTSSTSSVDPLDNRVGVNIQNQGTWGGSANSKDIGLYVSNVSGQSSSSSNLAAVLNGNTVIGDLSSSSLIGANGSNVLAIQNGVAPLSPPGAGLTTNTGIQIFSDDIMSVSTFHVMNGDGTVIQLYQQGPIIAANTTDPNSGDADTDLLIKNLRDRVNNLEAILKNLGLILP